MLLVGFAKTKLLGIGDVDTVKITVESPYEFASYDYKGKVDVNYKGYIVKSGSYNFAISTDAHSAHNPVIKVNASVADNIKYDVGPVRKNPVVNQYTDQAGDRMNS